jgi:hypothetical protein
LRWVLEQGVTPVVKSFNKVRMRENLHIFNWELNVDDWVKIKQIPQRRAGLVREFVSEANYDFQVHFDLNIIFPSTFYPNSKFDPNKCCVVLCYLLI